MKAYWGAIVGAAVVGLVVSGCARTGDKSFRTRAAQDLQCPAGQLRIEHKWENGEAQKKAVGCGWEAYYVRECQHEGCLWKMKEKGAEGSTPPVAGDGANPPPPPPPPAAGN